MKIKTNYSFFSSETQRISPKNIQRQNLKDPLGIKVHRGIFAWIRLIFGLAAVLQEKSGKVWYVNKASLRRWMKNNANEQNKKPRLSNLDRIIRN